VAAEAPAAVVVADPAAVADAVEAAAVVVDRGSGVSPAGRKRKERPVW